MSRHLLLASGQAFGSVEQGTLAWTYVQVRILSHHNYLPLLDSHQRVAVSRMAFFSSKCHYHRTIGKIERLLNPRSSIGRNCT
jgi:hypothetical protein